MKISLRWVLLIALIPACFAQPFEIGVLAGAADATDLTVNSSRSGSADAGLKLGAAAGVTLTDHMYQHLGGEVRYVARFGKLKLSSGGAEATRSALVHSIHYDFLAFLTGRRAAFRPFLAAGGGARFYQGLGSERPFQELSRFALLTKTREFQPLVDFGGGIQARISDQFFFRVEFRDYVTPAPTKVIAPAPGAGVSGWLHDLTPMIGVSYSFTPRIE